MGHTAIEKLQDLDDLLEKMRALEGMKEQKPAIFYLKSKPFLHFHDKGDQRWADARDGESWGAQIVIPFKATFWKPGLDA